jgi:parvulin-like peptidyl-prolyl isomerase
MSQNVTNELIYDVLKQVQADMAEVKGTLADHTRQFIRVREDINSLRGDDLRRESLQTQMDVRLQRIEKRLNLSDA